MKHFKISARWKQILLVISVIGLALLYSFDRYVQSSLNQALTLPEPKLWTVQPGTSIRKLCRELKEKAIVESCSGLKIAGRLKPEITKIQSGTYLLSPGMRFRDVLLRLNQGKEHQFTFTIVEGENYFQVLDKVTEQAYLRDDVTLKPPAKLAQALGLDAVSPEGYFYPETYYYTANSSALKLLQRAVEQQKQILRTLWLSAPKATVLSDPYDALILASIIEKESAQQDERDVIASVFYNRLRKGMRLQTDPTVIYGVWSEYKGDITRQHMKRKTPYNTYRINGLWL